MQIDWFTVIAQIVNFLILVYLLRRFLYRPVTEAMRRRQERVAETVREAQEREREAVEEARRLRRRQEELEGERRQILERAREEAEVTRSRLQEEARAEVAELGRRWRAELAREQEELGRGLRRQAAREVVHAARRALEDLCDAELEGRAVRVFLERLAALPEEGRRRLAADGPVRVTTGFELDETLQAEVVAAVREQLGMDGEIELRTRDELLCGIELSAGGRRLRWSVEDYLDGLEERLGRQIEAAEIPGENGDAAEGA